MPGKSSAEVVTRRQVVAFRIERAGLAKRSVDVARAVGELGLPDFPPGAAGLALAVRVAKASASMIADEFEKRRLVRVRAMRGAPVVARAEDYDVLVAGMLPPDEKAMAAFIGPAMTSVKAAKMSAVEAVELISEEAGGALAGGPLDRDAVHAALRRALPKGLLPYCRPCESHHVHPSLLYAAALVGRWLIFPRDEGPYVIARADRWLRKAGKTKGAVAELVRRFLRMYGPASTAEFAAWSGTGGGQPQAAWAAVADEIVPVSVEGVRAKRFVLAEDRKKLTTAGDMDGVRLVSPGDPLLQMRDRDVLVPERKLQQVIWKTLSPSGVVLAGGEVAGIVKARKQRDVLEVSVEAIRKLDSRARAGVEEDAARLALVRGSGLRVVWK